MKIFAGMGWLLALVLLAIVLVLMTKNRQLEAQGEQTVAQAASLRKQLEALQAMHQSGAEKSALEEQPAAMAGAAEEAPALDARPAESVAEPPSEGAPEPGSAQEDALPQLNEQQQRMLNVQTGALSQMMFGEFLAGLNLPQDALDSVNAEIQEALGRSMLLDQQALQREPSWTGKEFGAKKEAIRGALRERLAAYLSPDQLAAWDAQEAAANQVLYEQVVGGQLATLVPNLNEEARRTIQMVLGEELALRLEALDQSEEAYTPALFVQAQRTALEEGAIRLQDALNEEEQALLQQYIDQAERTFQAIAPGG